MFAYLNEPETNVIVDTEGETVTFDELIECLWDCLELNVENYTSYNMGNDCVACTMLAQVNGLYVEIIFNERDLNALNEKGWETFSFGATSRDLWFEEICEYAG